MIRAIAGVLDRRGRPDVGVLERALPGARTAVDGSLALAWTGAEAAVDGGLCLVDGTLDRDPLTATEGAPADAEAALLAAWRTRPDGLLANLRGDFALLLWDGRRGLLASDHVATRCWFHSDDGSVLRFATEIHLLLATLARRPAPDPVGLAHWLAVSGMPGDHTLYDGVHRLSGGHELALDVEGARTARRYWELRPVEPVLAPRGEHAARWLARLQTSVARRMVAPAETGVLLSGGLDSGAVAAALPDVGRPERAYSAVFPDHPDVDESALIAELTDSLRLRSVRAVVRGGSVLGGALPHLERWEVPPVSPNLFFWTPLLARAAADGTRVLLDGEGGDELLGLAPMLVADRLASGDVLGAIGLVYQAPGALGRPSRRSVRRYLRQAGLRALAPAWMHDLSRRARGPKRYAPSWMGAALAQAYHGSIDGAAWKRIDGPRWWAWKVETTLRGMGATLSYDHIRHRSADAGVLARHPILDVDLVETVLATPPELSFDPYVGRPLLREAVAGRIPESVRSRVTKSGFDVLFHEALAGPDLPLLRGLVGGPDARLGAYVDLDLVRAELLEGPPPAGDARSDWAMEVWRLLTAECWLRFQENPGEPRRAAEAIGVASPAVEIAAV